VQTGEGEVLQVRAMQDSVRKGQDRKGQERIVKEQDRTVQDRYRHAL
jgi:hypothetical protein